MMLRQKTTTDLEEVTVGRDWYRQIAEIMLSLNSPNLPLVLTSSLRDIAPFEHSVAFGYPEGRRPIFLFDGFGSDQKKSYVAPYLNGSYLVDPFYEACMEKIQPGLYRMRDLAPDEFYESVGAHPGYVSPCISDQPGFLSEEIGFFARVPSGAYVVLSLMRPHDDPPFSAAEFAWLTRVEPVVQAAMMYYWRDLGSAASEPKTAVCLGDYVQGALARFGTPVLTEREREIAQLILRGHSSESIAKALGITLATVKIHRRNIYAKLNVSSQAELFTLFIDIISCISCAPAPSETPRLALSR